jgi:hypothetical protein
VSGKTQCHSSKKNMLKRLTKLSEHQTAIIKMYWNDLRVNEYKISISFSSDHLLYKNSKEGGKTKYYISIPLESFLKTIIQ